MQSLTKHKTAKAPLKENPRILFVTPEISYVSRTMCMDAERLKAKAGGLADVSALLTDSLHNSDKDIHLAIPNYRHLFSRGAQDVNKPLNLGERIHLARDCRFHRRNGVYLIGREELHTSALVFQREVINNIIPQVQPDIIHCNDWMTGLIPAAAKQMGIPCLFTIHNIHSDKATLADMENSGIPARDFWENYYYLDYPHDFDSVYWTNPVDFLASGIHAADYVNVVSPSFLEEIASGHHDHVPGHINHLLYHKKSSGAASGIINAPDLSFQPELDTNLFRQYDKNNYLEAKALNKLNLQSQIGLTQNRHAPLLFWPSRLDHTQKGCQLLTEILFHLIQDYSHLGLQIVLVADGPFQHHFHDIINHHSLHQNVAMLNFSEHMSHLAYGSSDFILMPSSFEPCGLPQMIGARYGTLPIVYRTGGLRDTVSHLNLEEHTGNGFLFDHFNSEGFRWAIDQALNFYTKPEKIKTQEIQRIMTEAKTQFCPKNVLHNYCEIYENLTKT